jgi:hypothetical protein
MPKEGWNCPKCGGAHGPHVPTCPVILGDGNGTVTPFAHPYRAIVAPAFIPTPRYDGTGLPPIRRWPTS